MPIRRGSGCRLGERCHHDPRALPGRWPCVPADADHWPLAGRLQRPAFAACRAHSIPCIVCIMSSCLRAIAHTRPRSAAQPPRVVVIVLRSDCELRCAVWMHVEMNASNGGTSMLTTCYEQ